MEAQPRRCELCGAPLSDHDLCSEVWGEVAARAMSDAAYGSVHLLAVDSYILQHSEDHSPRSNAFHLLRLSWLLHHGGDPDMRQGNQGPIPHLLQSYRAFPFLAPPAPQQRGAVTVSDARQAATPQAYQRVSRQWAAAVWEAFHEHHAWVKDMLAQSGVRDRQ